MKKLFLKIDELRVESFVTIGARQGRGTVAGHATYTREDEWTMPDTDPMPPMHTILECPTIANDCPTVGDPGCDTIVCTMDCPTQFCPTREGDSCNGNCTSIC